MDHTPDLRPEARKIELAPPVVVLDWRTIVVMLSGGILVTLALVGVTVVLPQIEIALAHDAMDKLLIKELAMIIGLTMVIGAPLAGFLVDRMGLKPVFIASCIIYAIAGTAGLYLDSLPALFVSRLFVGLTAAGNATMSMTLINSRLDPYNRAKWMGRHVAAAMVATIMLSPVIGLLGEISWRGPFAIYALALPLALIGIGIKDVRKVRAPVPSAAVARPTESLMSWLPVRYIVLSVFLGIITYLPTVYLPFVIRGTGVTSPTIISLVMFADSIIATAWSLMFARSQLYITHHAAFMYSFSCCTVGMLIVALSTSFVGVLCGTLVVGLGMGWYVPNLMTAAAKYVSLEHQGRTTGLVKAAHYLAAPVCVVLAEPLTRQIGPRGAMWIASSIALCLLGAFAYRVVTRHLSLRATPADLSLSPAQGHA